MCWPYCMSTAGKKGEISEVIVCRELEKSYCGKGVEVKVLKGINLKIDRGEFVCVYGKSGSGKSTLLNILGLLDKETSGTYELEGINVGRLNKKECARIRNQKIGFVFQSYHLIPELNALENIAVPLGYAGKTRKEREQVARSLLGEFNLMDLEKKYISQMSGGEQQRVAIARAIANSPDILLADEPTGNLDKENSRMVLELLQQLNADGMSIVMVTHDTTIAKYGTRVIYVEDGLIRRP